MSGKLDSAGEVMEALGGVDAVARLTGVTYRAAHNWKAARKFPARTHAALTAALAERGLSAPQSLWNQVEARAS